MANIEVKQEPIRSSGHWVEGVPRASTRLMSTHRRRALASPNPTVKKELIANKHPRCAGAGRNTAKGASQTGTPPGCDQPWGKRQAYGAQSVTMRTPTNILSRTRRRAAQKTEPRKNSIKAPISRPIRNGFFHIDVTRYTCLCQRRLRKRTEQTNPNESFTE